jgi:hypothetical protein
MGTPSYLRMVGPPPSISVDPQADDIEVESAAMPFPPEPAYTGPPFSRPSAPQTSTRANAPMYDAPPKYVPAQPEQPIVQTL